MPDYLSKLDELLNNLETAIEDVGKADFAIAPGEPPKPAIYRIVSEYVSSVDRKPRRAEVHAVQEGLIVMRSRNDAARGSLVEIHVLMSKDGGGETMHVMKAAITRSQRISGAYEIQAAMSEMQTVTVPAHRRFLECVANGDAAAWNRWCADLREGPELKALDLARSDLSGFDLCCADLSGGNLGDCNLAGADLSGANLKGCVLDGANVSGADLFRTRLPRKYMDLILASGTAEVESVILGD